MERRIKNNKKDTTHHDVNGWFFGFVLEVRRWCLMLDGVVGGEVLLGHPDLPTSPSLCY